MQKKLPPLPPSDEASLEKNHYDAYYRVNSRNFWKDAEINRIPDEPVKTCDHEFQRTRTGVECRKCHFGLIGALEVRDGHLFIRGEQVNFSTLKNI